MVNLKKGLWDYPFLNTAGGGGGGARYDHSHRGIAATAAGHAARLVPYAREQRRRLRMDAHFDDTALQVEVRVFLPWLGVQ